MQGWCRQPNDVGSNSWQDSTVTELSIATTAAQYVDGDDDGDSDCGSDSDDEITTDNDNYGGRITAGVEAYLADIGGNRGIVANCDLKSGTLILAEMPIIVWPKFTNEDKPQRLKIMAKMA